MPTVHAAGYAVPTAPTIETPPTAGGQYQEIRAPIGAFGGFTGEALSNLSNKAEQAAGHFENIQAFHDVVSTDEQANIFEDSVNKKLYGDPNIPGDVGYMGLQGRNAVEQRQTVQKAIDDQLALQRSGMQNARQLHLFDQASRRYRNGALSKIGEHYDSQYVKHASETAASSASNAIDRSGVAAANNDFSAWTTNLTEAVTKHAQSAALAGKDPETIKSEIATITRSMAENWFNTQLERDPLAARQFLDNHKELFGSKYDEMITKSHEAARAQDTRERIEDATRAANGLPPVVRNRPKLGVIQPPPTGPVPDQVASEAAKQGVSHRLAMTTAEIESNFGVSSDRKGSQYQGVFQLGDNERQSVGGKEVQHGVAFLAKTKTALAESLGREPADWEVYLAHNQGVAGATSLLKNPDKTAEEAITSAGGSPTNIRSNFGGDPTKSSKTYTDIVQAEFNSRATRYEGKETEAPKGHLNYGETGALGDPNTPGWRAANIVTIKSPSGASFEVHKNAAQDFTNFLNDLDASGYKVRPEASSSYNLRNKRGGTTLSEHAYGTAIDINSDVNLYTKDGRKVTDLPPSVAALAEKHNLEWGGNWTDPVDTMHFQWRGPRDTAASPAAPAAPTPAAPAPPGPVAPRVVGQTITVPPPTGAAQPAPTPAPGPQAASSGVEVWGDSLGVGLNSRLQTPGKSSGGAQPAAILANIKKQPEDSWKGKTVVLSSGSNGNQMPHVEDTINYLKDRGANVIAVGYGPKFPEKNAKLAEIAGRLGVQVIAAQDVDPKEGVHPSPSGYDKMTAAIRGQQAAAPAAPSGGGVPTEAPASAGEDTYGGGDAEGSGGSTPPVPAPGTPAPPPAVAGAAPPLAAAGEPTGPKDRLYATPRGTPLPLVPRDESEVPDSEIPELERALSAAASKMPEDPRGDLWPGIVKGLRQQYNKQYQGIAQAERLRKIGQDKVDREKEEAYVGRMYDPTKAPTEQEIAQDKSMSLEARKRTIDLQRSLAKPDPRPDENNRNELEIMRRLGLPDGDPEKVTNEAQIRQLAIEKKITVPTMKEMINEFRAQNNTRSQQINQDQTRLIDSAKPIIDPWHGTPGMDPTGEAAARKAAYEAYAIGAIRAAKEDPKALHALLNDPTSPTYLGRAELLQAYGPQGSIGKGIKEQYQKAAPTKPLRVMNSPDDLMAAFNAGEFGDPNSQEAIAKMSALGIARGWIRPNAAPGVGAPLAR